MPDMDGIETTHKIRALENNENNKIPIIALTANALSGMREIFLSEGLNDFLSKPIDPSKLNAVLADWLPLEKIKYDIPEIQIETTTTEEPEHEQIFIDGINYQNGLSFAGGDKSTYIDILTTFSNDCEKREKEIRQMVETNDIQGFTTNIHGLKSAARYIGADNVSDLAETLEDAGQNNDISFINENFEECISLYKEVCINIKKFLDSKKPTATENLEEGSISLLKETAIQLKQYAYDMDIVNFEESLKKVANYSWNDIIKSKLDAVSQAAYSYDYEKMSKEAEELIDFLK